MLLLLQDHPRLLKTIYVLSTPKGKKILTAAALLGTVYLVYPRVSTRKDSNGVVKSKASVFDRKFLSQLKDLILICIPSWRSKQTLLLGLLTGSLVARTLLSLYVAELDGKIVKSIVDHNLKDFLHSLGLWIGIAIPATYVNSIIKYLENTTSLSLRNRLVHYCYGLYMQNDTYYKIGNLDNRLANVDQCLTEDLSKFTFKLAHLYSQLTKPSLDFVLMTWQLVRLARQNTTGGAGVAGAIGMIVIILTARVLKFFQPPFGKMAVKQAELEGELRFAHSRLITNSEEIAFFRGDKIEKTELSNRYTGLMRHMYNTFRARILYHMLEGFFMKYIWSAAGLVMIALPSFLYSKHTGETSEVISGRTKAYITSKKLLIDAADAIERVMLSVKEINELGGYTSRVWDMIQIFKQVQHGEYQGAMLAKIKSNEKLALSTAHTYVSDYIKFEDVPIVSPAGDVLVEKLTFEVQPGQHLLITGPNGCGKSSLFRILGGLWPSVGGNVYRPKIESIFYLPQRPYLSVGNLRDEVIYPDTPEQMKAKGVTDADLYTLLEMVYLTHILEREGGWNSQREWKDVLSGGEKQRLGMARIFYHKPKYAILDECTSAVSIDVEGKMYQQLVDMGITLLTVSHRPSLWKYHKLLLQFDGEGGWKFTELNAEERMSLKEEKTKLEGQLSGIPKMQERLFELCRLLGEDSVVLSKEKPKHDEE